MSRLLQYLAGKPSQNQEIPYPDIEKALKMYCTPPISKDRTNQRIPSENFKHIAGLLKHVEAHEKVTGWYLRPRIYTVLRNIGRLVDLPKFIELGITDIAFPFSRNRLCDVSEDHSFQRLFLKYQEFVLTKASELEKGGEHQSFSTTADDHFRVIRHLGSGGFGHVDLIWSRLSCKYYARKQFSLARRSNETLQKFENELQTLKRLSHHHLVRVIGSYTDQECVAFLMEPVADCNLMLYLHYLEKSFERNDYSHLPSLRTFFGCITNAINYLHNQKIRHRDLKPQNILVKDGKLYIADFGTALDWSNRNRSTTQSTNVAKTPYYMAPEVGKNEPRSSASDMWSIGIVFLEMTTVLRGKRLRDMMAFMKKHGTGRSYVWSNIEAAHAWFEVLRQSEVGLESDNEPLSWIKGLIQLQPINRPRPRQLLELILESSSSHSFLAFCCEKSYTYLENDTESLASSVSEEDEEIDLQVLEDVNYWSAPTVPMLPTARRNHIEDWLGMTQDSQSTSRNAEESAAFQFHELAAITANGQFDPQNDGALFDSTYQDAGYHIDQPSIHEPPIDQPSPLEYEVVDDDSDGSSNGGNLYVVSDDSSLSSSTKSKASTVIAIGNLENKLGLGDVPELDDDEGITDQSQNGRERSNLSAALVSNDQSELGIPGLQSKQPDHVGNGTDVQNKVAHIQPQIVQEHYGSLGDSRLQSLQIISSNRTSQIVALPINEDARKTLTKPEIYSDVLSYQSGEKSSIIVPADHGRDKSIETKDLVNPQQEVPQEAQQLLPQEVAQLIFGPDSSVKSQSIIGPGKDVETKFDEGSFPSHQVGIISREPQEKPLISKPKRQSGVPRVPGAIKSEISIKSYMQQVWEAESSAPTSVLSENSARQWAQKKPLLKWQDKTSDLLSTYASRGKAAVVKILLEAGCNPGTKEKPRTKPLHRAVVGQTARHVKCVRLLLIHGADVNMRFRDGKTPLHLAIDQTEHESYTKLVYELLEAGADPNIKDKNGDFPLLQILYAGYGPLPRSRRDALALLIRADNLADVNVMPPGTQNMPLHLAIRRKDPWAVGMLLDRGASIKQANGAGLTPLLLAAHSWTNTASNQKEQAQVLEQLLKYGADVSETGGDLDNTALHLAVEQGREDVTTLLLSYGADCYAKNKSGKIPFSLAMNASARANPASHAKVMETLCQSMNIELPHPQEECIYASAIANGDITMTKLLLNYGADVNHCIKAPPRPLLHEAIEKKNPQMVSLLLSYGAQMDKKSESGVDAYECASNANHSSIRTMLNAEEQRRRRALPDSGGVSV